MSSRWNPFRATRWRVALFATLASGLLFTAAVLWFSHAMAENLINAAHAQARDKNDAVRSLLDSGATPAQVAARLPDGHFVIEPAGHPVNCPDDPEAPHQQIGGATVYPPDCVLGGNSGPSMQLENGGTSANGRYVFYAWSLLDPLNESTVDTARRLGWYLVPVASLLVGAVAFLSVRRSLRAVEHLRSEVADVSAADLTRRVRVPDSGDEITSLALTMNTILARLERSVNRLGQFTSDAAHELRTPVASIRTQLEVLLAHPDNLDPRRGAHNALEETGRIEDLISDLLLLSRLDAEAAPAPQEVAITTLVRSHLATRAAVEVHAEGDPVVPGDARALERLLRNLVDNAERHATSRVWMTVTETDTEVRLTVEDDGPGIPPEHRERVFDRFVRLDDARSRDEGGSGLGLAIAAAIARRHHGRLAVLDRPSGSAFELTLPRS